MSEKTTQQETADRQAPANELLEALGTTISPDLLVQALTHRSFSHEHPGVSNYERLEFLGDAVLELVATVLSQALSAVWALKFLCGKNTILRIKKKNLKIKASVFLPCAALGIAPFAMQATESVLEIGRASCRERVSSPV